MTQISDNQLIREIQTTPDSPALHQLFVRYSPVLRRLQRRYYIPGHDANDWQQEGLLVLHAAARSYRLDRSRNFGAFYRLNLTHRVYDLIRYSQAKKRHATTVSLEEHRTFFADTLVDPRVQVRDQLEVQEALQRVLPELSRTETVVLRGLLRGWSPTTISERCALSPTRVTAALHRGRQKLRRTLAQ